MKLLLLGLATLAASVPTFAQTSAPAAPTLTAGAEFKGLQFDWDPVAGASWYQLELRAHRTGAFVQQGDDIPSTTTSFRFQLPLHLFDWTYARYRVGACNSAGCTYSSEVSVSDLRTLAVGYFKTLATLNNMNFGHDLDISPDGNYFVASSPGDVIYVNGADYNGGSIAVFKRKSNGLWGQRARLVPVVPPVFLGSNDMRVAISADGDTVALSIPDYLHSRDDAQTGEVFVFHFDGTSKWIRTRIPRVDSGRFGDWVGINDAGNTLAVGVNRSNTRVAMYKLVNGAWTNVRNIPVGKQDCRKGVFSRDGSTVAEPCFIRAAAGGPTYMALRVFSGPNWTTLTELPMTLPDAGNGAYLNMIGIGIDRNGSTIAAQIYADDVETTGGPSQVNVFKRAGSVYAQVAELKPGSWRDGFEKWKYGRSVSVSGDGSTIAVGDESDNGFGAGPRAAPLNSDSPYHSGAAYIYRLKGTAWVLANMVKPNMRAPDNESFARELALSDNGKTLIVGEETENGNSEGIGGDWTHTGSEHSGAVWMY